MKMSKVREAILAYLFLAPALVVLSIFTFWPIGFSFVLSFFKWDFRNMKSPYFYGLGNYKEILKFDYPVKFPFHVGLVYSLVYIGLAILIVTIVSEIFRIGTRKKPSAILYVLLAVMVAYFLVRNSLNFVGSVIFAAVIGLFLFIALRKKLFYKKFFEDHAWFAFLIWIVSYIIFEFRLSAGLNGETFGIISFFMDAAEKNLFFKALVNTTYYVVLTVPIGLTLALLIALLLNNDIKFRAVFRTAFFIPFVTSSVAVGLIWKWIYNDDVGLLNYFLTSLGLKPVRWLKDAKWTIPTVSIVSIWKNVGYNAIIFLAGLQNIDAFYYEAAEVDGANSWQKFLKITWPLLSPTTFFLVIVSVIGAFKVFQEVFVLYDGLPGPYGNSGMTMVYYVFDLFYRQQRMGIASAAAYLLFLIILAFTFIQYRVGNRVVEYVS
ncbi:carbohydrate ABC transporter permease [Fervidobacterium thailandense]|uniref:Sugar ABC transporter permease n=1 Tax=Fervidobacterium thailandense TaxID=1008305 RepID=A0A1E3G5M3_9BACT|nr:sugar ABC transporter permease [Fervidobacterium thailandense]ODN30958.1 sugar ABC transporter permease [Fervidobacterium thailandense]